MHTTYLDKVEVSLVFVKNAIQSVENELSALAFKSRYTTLTSTY